YLKKTITAEEIAKLGKELAGKYYVQKNATDAIQFISKEDASKKFIKETGEDFQKLLGENPLHDALIIRIAESWQGKVSLAKIKKELEQDRNVFQVSYEEREIESINKNITQIGFVLMGLVTILLIIVVLLINNTLRLALFSQRFLIRSMQLVGATKWFIQRPFLIRASMHGLLSGAMASGMLVGLIYFATKKIEELKLIQNNEMIAKLIGCLLILGIIVAVVSSYRAVNKYLKLSLDELY
ncbi:MAG TPA: cell division protein, partial [Cytophagales bacterium]|nr:cell division protein [Cytophagales bacterium]